MLRVCRGRGLHLGTPRGWDPVRHTGRQSMWILLMDNGKAVMIRPKMPKRRGGRFSRLGAAGWRASHTLVMGCGRGGISQTVQCGHRRPPWLGGHSAPVFTHLSAGYTHYIGEGGTTGGAQVQALTPTPPTPALGGQNV